jgi:membrane protein DedA with SNARE-associated domain
MHEIFHHLFVTWFHWVEHWGYLGVILLMAMESSVIPVPSEIVIPPAAFLAIQPGSHMTLWGVVLAGTFGCWLGAALSYWISRWVGRVFIVNFGRYFMISEKKLERAEQWVHRYEAGGIFFARLLPVVRHLISIPAGIIRMGFGVFSAMTILGSLIWCSVLAWFGQKVMTPSMMEGDPTVIIAELKKQSHLVIGAIVVLCILYFIVLKLTAKPAKSDAVL